MRISWADILQERLISCISDNVNLKEEIQYTFDIYDRCNLDREIFGPGSNFYFNISIYNGSLLFRELTGGKHTFQKDCKIAEAVIAENFPRCSETKEILMLGNEEFNLIILTGSVQEGGGLEIETEVS